MDWQQSLVKLVEVLPKLAFTPELISQLKKDSEAEKPPKDLGARLEVIACVIKQNQRVANLHGYPTLSTYAERAESDLSATVSALKQAGMSIASKGVST